MLRANNNSTSDTHRRREKWVAVVGMGMGKWQIVSGDLLHEDQAVVADAGVVGG